MDERERIREAVLDLVFEHGCDETSLAMVLDRARVPAAAFEREFGSLEDCFLQIYVASNEEFVRDVGGAYAGGGTWRDSLRAAAYVAARFLRDRPREVRLNVIQVFRAGEMAMAERDRYHQLLVDLVDAGRNELDDPDSVSRSVAEAVVGSIVGTMMKRVGEDGSAVNAEAAVPELMYVAVRPYLGHEAALEELTIPPPESAASAPLPESHGTGPFAAHASDARARIRQAAMELVVERSLAHTDVGAVVERAGVERVEFDQDFDDLDDCCTQIYLANVAEFDRLVFAAGDGAGCWRDRLRVIAYAAARHVGERPLETRFDMVQMLSAQGSAQAYRDRYVRRIVDLIDEGRQELDDPDSLGRGVAEGVFGSIYEALFRELRAGRGTGAAEEVVPQLMCIAVRPYLGHEAALEELTITPPRSETDANANKTR